MTKPDYERACAYALDRLERELPSNLCYHSLQHTRDDVLPAVERLAAHEGVGGEAFLLLRTAAVYHDLGFVDSYSGHEAAGARIARAMLPQFGFSARQIKVITDIISATKLPQQPRNLLERIMVDADLDSLGREDFFKRSEDLRRELAAYNRAASKAEWYREQLAFVAAHAYFTDAAHALRDATKQHNLQELAARLRASEVSSHECAS
jgi:uncharacterized protein